ncbi:probable DNA mismatch repair protein Msh6 isoform X1 [Lucilia sericata]|uniref:probable DNA mismatch repair protein Msh6 isoform X1 n=1 Tax=Lucilia sericata TaxID=13632 RepID=UPI0018A8002E|nr:probable DNA mismatch repair protein Msh6 isoform X1 [Lucilia sericata]
MSKKLNTSLGSSVASPKNNLFNYFSRSPATLEKKKIPVTPSAGGEEKQQKNEKNVMEKENLQNKTNKEENSAKQKIKKSKIIDSDEEEVATTSKKRRRLVLQDSEEEEEEQTKKSRGKAKDDSDYEPNKDEEMPSDNEEEKGDSEVESSTEIKKNHNNNNEPKSKKTKLDATLTAGSFMDKLEQLKAGSEGKTSKKQEAKCEEVITSNLDEPVVWPHQKLEFLKADKIKDKQGRRPDHPDYDPSTLYVPPKFLDSLSPGVRQWWVLKSESFDCVLFFKVGKFYELYHMDADVGVNELGFTYMRGEFAHSGFPEISFDKMASVLVERGYKVARVEQTETPDMMTERCKRIKPTKFDKVVRREICQITSRGTQVFGSQCQITPNHQPNYMLAIVEQQSAQSGGCSSYGICFIDTSIGDCYLGEFEDDTNCSRLLTLLSHNMPVLVVLEKANIQEKTQDIMRTVLSGVLKEYMPNVGSMQSTAEKTLKELAEKYYAGGDNWPMVLRTMQSETDHLGLTPHADAKLALKALGLCLNYMKKCHVAEKVLPMARYHLYQPPDTLALDKVPSKISTNQRAHMVLDATTLMNLRITGEEHSLQSTLDQCCTKFGKRLLHHWLCAPSCVLSAIVERQEAITDFLNNPSLLQEARALLAPLPDFERHLAQIHHFGSKIVQESHPDGRAIFFEEKQYNKKKMQNFISILKGFESLLQIPTIFQEAVSKLLKRLTQYKNNEGIFPDLTEELNFFKQAFDHTKAAETGVIAPESGVDEDYDRAEAKIKEINKKLQEYLVEQEKIFGCRINYFGSDKKRFQLEIPEARCRKVDSSYSLEGQKKGVARRYTTDETRSFLKQMQAAEDERNTVLKDLSRRIFEKFSQHYDLWKQCVDCVAHVDVLASLAEYARTQQVICIPQLEDVDAGKQAFIEIEEGYHPCVSADTYIPNGVVLGCNDTAPLSILTGPNMGGKSTLMRQVGLLAVMAQIGAHVPAQSCRLSLVDRIFTRLGAQDDILSGHSTFLVELNETSLILKHATANSLVLLDELGRGTATYDGTAIAASVVNFLADLKCRSLFSTHYHNLIDFFHKDERITLGHMACMVENEDCDDPTQETVTFLYKYSAGACPKSYGFNAAKLAGMPHNIIKRAYTLSKKLKQLL